jgi:hypothetical protein
MALASSRRLGIRNSRRMNGYFRRRTGKRATGATQKVRRSAF